MFSLEIGVQSLQKEQSEGVHFFVKSALKLQCHVGKNTLLQTAFSATGIVNITLKALFSKKNTLKNQI